MKKKVTEIANAHYVETNREERVGCEPSKEEIERAVHKKHLEKRGFQDHRRELIAEWNEGGSFEEYCDRARKYHARRIAFFVVNRWNHPIVLNKDKRVHLREQVSGPRPGKKLNPTDYERSVRSLESVASLGPTPS